jgi:hypothetical protein
MKKLLFLATALTVMSCSTDEQSTPQTPVDCNCGTIIEKNNFTGVVNFTILKVKNNCTDEIKVIQQNGNVGVLNGQWCN